MTTKNDIFKNFHTEFVRQDVLPEGLEEQWLIKAIGDFEMELYELKYNETDGIFSKTLSQMEINTLSTLMYSYYLKRERDRYSRVHSVMGKDIGVTGLGDTKRVLDSTVKEIKSDLDNYFHKLKDNTYL